LLKPLFTLIVAGGVAWFGYDALRDGSLDLPSLPSPPAFEQPAGAVVSEEAVAEIAPEGNPAREFRQALKEASGQAETLFTMGEKKSRNIPEILNEQRKMGSRLGEIDALIASGTLPPELQPAIDAYTSGSADVRNAMERAKEGFTKLDWEKVRNATSQMRRGFESLATAAKLANAGS
jgi:hypothetical protein